MKLMIATTKPFKLDDVRKAVTGLMVAEIKGFGAESGHTETYREAEYADNFAPKIKLEIVIEAAMAEAVVEAIISTALTGGPDPDFI